MSLQKIDTILENKGLELPYSFQKHLINDLINLGNIEEEDLESFIITLSNLFIEIANGSTCLILEKDPKLISFTLKYPDIINYEKAPLILREIGHKLLLYRERDYIDEIKLEEALKERLENNEISNNIFIENTNENIKKALSYNTILITGGPGSGKTSLATDIYKAFSTHIKNDNRKPEIKIAAPTGKAAKVLADRIDDENGVTIHKLLEYSPLYDKFKYHKDFKLKADLIIIDEASMIDLRLFKNLLEGIEKNTRLIIIGDKDQLPSVDNGAVFTELVESNLFPVIKLTSQYRSNENILTLAKKINSGDTNIFNSVNEIEINDLKEQLEKNENNVYFIELRGKTDLLKIINIVANHYKESIQNTKILGFTNKGFLGIENINKIIIENYKDIMKEVPIMITENDYENNVFNGDIGILENNYSVKFSDGLKISLNLLKNWRYAFAITVHKSQGSGYDDVFLILADKKENPLLTRELLYTGVTRAKNRVFIIGKKDVFLEGIIRKSNRYSGMVIRLK